jgi:hypothetical protein
MGGECSAAACDAHYVPTLPYLFPDLALLPHAMMNKAYRSHAPVVSRGGQRPEFRDLQHS